MTTFPLLREVPLGSAGDSEYINGARTPLLYFSILVMNSFLEKFFVGCACFCTLCSGLAVMAENGAFDKSDCELNAGRVECVTTPKPQSTNKEIKPIDLDLLVKLNNQ